MVVAVIACSARLVEDSQVGDKPSRLALSISPRDLALMTWRRVFHMTTNLRVQLYSLPCKRFLDLLYQGAIAIIRKAPKYCPSQRPSPTMSSPHPSPPKTHLKEPTIAVDKENTAPRTPLPDTPVNSTDNVVVSVEGDKPKNPGEEVQVPSTLLAKPNAPIHEPEEVHTSDQVEHEHANDTEEPTSDSETISSEAVVSDLPVFDWEDLERRYIKGITAVNKAEDEILEEFYKYSDVGSLTPQRMVELC